MELLNTLRQQEIYTDGKLMNVDTYSGLGRGEENWAWKREINTDGCDKDTHRETGKGGQK